MAFDLHLTNTGDISFLTSNSNSRNEVFEFNFHVAPTDSLLFNFSIENYTNVNQFSNKELRMNRVKHTLNSIEELDSIQDPKVKERIYIKNENKVYEITLVNEIMLIDNEISKSIGQIRPVEISPTFSYEFYAYTLKHNKVGRTVSDKDYIEQAIRLRLNTEIGSIRGNETIGGDIFKFIHLNMDTNKLLTKLSAQVKNSISDILPNCKVEAYIINNDYLNYHDSIKIVIINNEEVYYYYV